MARVHDADTGAKLEARELRAEELREMKAAAKTAEQTAVLSMKFAMQSVPGGAAELGYATISEYAKLTREQQSKATRFTHDITEVAVITQPKGTGSLQRPPCTDQTGERIRQVGSAGHSTLRGATDGSAGVEMVTHPFNRTALHARSAARSKKARAENTERERETSDEWQKRQYSVDLEVQQEMSERENMQQGLTRGAVVWARS